SLDVPVERHDHGHEQAAAFGRLRGHARRTYGCAERILGVPIFLGPRLLCHVVRRRPPTASLPLPASQQPKLLAVRPTAAAPGERASKQATDERLPSVRGASGSWRPAAPIATNGVRSNALVSKMRPFRAPSREQTRGFPEELGPSPRWGPRFFGISALANGSVL